MKKIKLFLILLLLTCLAATAFSRTNETTVSRAEFEEKFVGVLSGQLPVGLDKLSGETRFREDLGADDTDLAELLMALEDYLDVSVGDEQWAGVTTVESAIDLLFEIKNSSRY